MTQNQAPFCVKGGPPPRSVAIFSDSQMTHLLEAPRAEIRLCEAFRQSSLNFCCLSF